MAEVNLRDAAIAQYDVLGHPAGRDLQALVELAVLVCEVPHAAINVITSDHQHQVATAGIHPSVCAREDSMCAAVLGDTRVVVSPDASKDSRFAVNPFVDGRVDSVRFYASAPMVTPDGTTIGRLCVFDHEPHDLPARKTEVLTVLAARIVDVLELRLRSRQLEQSVAELGRTRDELARSNEMLTLFAGQISHDLRSPLTAVLANAELLAEDLAGSGDPTALQLANGIVSAGRRMSWLIESLLAYARVGGTLDLVDVPLDHLIGDIWVDLRPTFADRHAELRFSGLPTLHADADQLRAVLQNLITNAVKFTPPAKTLVVGVTAERDGDFWKISVSDNGRGVRPEQRESMFELYSRGDRSVPGSGIGLATARRAVEAHGGRIGIDDAPGGGTTVWFTIPV